MDLLRFVEASLATTFRGPQVFCVSRFASGHRSIFKPNDGLRVTPFVTAHCVDSVTNMTNETVPLVPGRLRPEWMDRAKLRGFAAEPGAWVHGVYEPIGAHF
jgi:hypothetical protein